MKACIRVVGQGGDAESGYSQRTPKTLTWIVVAVALATLGSRPEQAHGTTYVSNTGESVDNGIALANNQWLAVRFVTGSDPAGYSLDSVDCLSDGVLGSPSGFNLFELPHRPPAGCAI